MARSKQPTRQRRAYRRGHCAQSSPVGSDEFRRRAAWTTASYVALILCATAIAYWPALRGAFIWDDNVYVTGNAALRDLEGLRRIWLAPGALPTQYYPLTLSALWIEHQIFGEDPIGYHVFSVLVHATNAALFSLLLARLRLPGALLAGLVFALHPMHVESVAWVTEQKNVISGLWVMLTLLAWARYASTATAWAYGAALACFAAALASKSAAVPLPLVLAAGAWGLRGFDRRRDLVALGPFVALALASVIVTVWVERGHGVAGGFGREFDWGESFNIAAGAFWFYPLKLLAPVSLAAIYPKWPIEVTAAWQLAAAAAALLVVVVSWRLRERWGRWPLVAIVSYAALIAPVLGFVDFGFLGHSFVADHFFYLPSIPLVALFCAAAALVTKRFEPHGREVALAGGAAVACVLAVLTHRQSMHYRTPETFWRHNLSVHPSHTAYHNLAEVAWARGDAQQTIAYELASIAVEDNARAHYRLGTVYDRLKRTDDSMREFELALEMNHRKERNPEIERNTLFNLGSLHWLEKDNERARKYWLAALEVDPDFAPAKQWLEKLGSDAP